MMTTEEYRKVYPGGPYYNSGAYQDPAFYWGGYRFHCNGYALMIHQWNGQYYCHDFPTSFTDKLPSHYDPRNSNPKETAEKIFRYCITKYKELYDKP